MNEAQLDQEIAKQQSIIDQADKTMQANDMTNTPNAQAMRQAFPLGVGGSGWTQSRINQRNRQIASDTRMAGAYTAAYQRKQAAETRLANLQAAKQEVAGTGKTQAELRQARQQAALAAPKSLKWASTKNGSQRVYTAGSMKITHSPGGFFILHANGKQYMFDKLKQAQTVAERLNK